MRRSLHIFFLVIVLNSQNVVAAEKPSEDGVSGIWLGGALYGQTFTNTVNATINGSSREIKSISANFLNFALTAQYMQMPIEGIGTSFSGSIGSSLNHSSAHYSMILSLNVQANLTYAKLSTDKTPYYFFGGLGYEMLSGTDIRNLVEAGAPAVQAGVGLVLFKVYNLETFYQITKHNVSSGYTDQLRTYLIAQGASSVTFNESQSLSNIFGARLTYKY